MLFGVWWAYFEIFKNSRFFQLIPKKMASLPPAKNNREKKERKEAPLNMARG